jgi:hypothetical protein
MPEVEMLIPATTSRLRASHGRPMLKRLAAALLLVPLVAACGGSSASPAASGSGSASGSARPSGSAAVSGAPSEQPSGSAGASAAPSASGAVAAQLIACDPAGPAFPVSNLQNETGAEQADNPAAKALRDFLASPNGSALPANDWREFLRTKNTVLYGQDDPSGQAGVYVFAKAALSGSSWNVPDSGQCHPRTWYANSYGVAADWKLGAKTSKTTTQFRALVTEAACAGGKTAAGRIAKPRIDYGDKEITITVAVKPLEGAQDCGTNPATPLTIKLSEPIGTRKLFNGGPYPSVEVTQPK